MIDSASADAEFGADFGLSHAIHIAVQDSEFQSGEFQCIHKFVIFCVICLFLFKAVYGIHWQRPVVRKIYVFDHTVSVGAIAQAADESVYFTIAGNFDGDLFATVDFREELCYHSRPKKSKFRGADTIGQ